MTLYHWESVQAQILLVDNQDDVMEIITKCKSCQFF
jgi:hypothetical protein